MPDGERFVILHHHLQASKPSQPDQPTKRPTDLRPDSFMIQILGT